LNATSPLNGNGNWSIIAGNGNFGGSTSLTNVSVQNLSIGNNVFEWTVSNTCGSNSAQVIVDFIDTPSQAVTENDLGTCYTYSLVHANTPLIGTGSWSVIIGNGMVANNNLATTNFINLNQGENGLVWTVANECGSSTDTLIVLSNIPPTVATVGQNQTICGGLTILSGNTPLEGNGNWSIKNGDGFFHTSNDPTTGIDSLIKGTTILVWTISNACASSSAELTINNSGPCENKDSLKNILYYHVPNAFTPNGDGLNNVFLPAFESGFEPLNFSMLIFNRWGQLIFESYNADYGWNGRWENDGEILQSGLYPWQITFTDIITQTEKIIEGFVVLAM